MFVSMTVSIPIDMGQVNDRNKQNKAGNVPEKHKRSGIDSKIDIIILFISSCLC